MSDKDHLSARQQQILNFIQYSTEEKGYSPSVREIGKAVGLASPSTVKHHLDSLQQKGLLARDGGLPRALRLNETGDNTASGTEQVKAIEIPVASSTEDEVGVPLVGRIAAGVPVLAEQNVDDVFTLPRRITGNGSLFVLEVTGDSMIDAAICDGDFVVIRSQPTAENGQIVAAMIEGEATVKVLSHIDGHTWLLPRNHEYTPIPADDASILGIVVALVRSI